METAMRTDVKVGEWMVWRGHRDVPGLTKGKAYEVLPRPTGALPRWFGVRYDHGGIVGTGTFYEPAYWERASPEKPEAVEFRVGDRFETKDSGTLTLVDDKDARLMAAAPEMLALLKNMVEAVEDEGYSVEPRGLRDAKALIARIEGPRARRSGKRSIG